MLHRPCDPRSRMATSALVIGCALLGVTGVATTSATTATAAPVQTATAAKSARPPHAPAIRQAQYTVAAFAGRPASIKVAWPALAGVRRFRARWTDAGARVDLDLPGTATSFERPEATAGHHQLSVVAIDEHGVESEPAEVAIDVVTITAIPPGGRAARPAPGPAFAIGSTFSSPGLACWLGDAPAARTAIATTPGATTLSCGGEPGQPRVDVPVVIAPVVIAGPTVPIAREAPTRIHVTIASVAPLGDHLQIEPIGKLTLGEVERSAMGIDVPVTALAGATAIGLVIRAEPIDPTGEDPRPAGTAVGVPTPIDRASPIDPTGEDPRPAGTAVGVPTPIDRASPIDPTGEDPRPAGTAVGVPTPIDRASPIDPTGKDPRPAGTAVGAANFPRGLELGRIDLALVERAPPPSQSEPQIRWFALDVGGQVGALVMLSEGKAKAALGMPSNPADTLTNAPLLGARTGLFPTRRVGIEGELSLAIPGYLGHPGFSFVTSARAQLAARLVEDQRYGLRLLGGAGLLGVLSRDGTSRRTIHGAVHWGAAFTIETRPDLWLRIEALHVITSAQDAGFAHNVELQLGVVTRLGRRDRSWR